MSGEGLVPDCSGCYAEQGVYGGKAAYTRCDGAYWIFWDTMAYTIAPTLGGALPPTWTGQTAVLIGDYDPGPETEGTATVAAYV